MPIGVLLIGAAGATASTLVAGSVAMASWIVEEEYGYTSLPHFANQQLVGTSDMVWGGWDLRRESAIDVVRRHGLMDNATIDSISSRLEDIDILPGILTDSDFSVNREGSKSTPLSEIEMVEQIGEDIELFRKVHGVERCVVVNLSNPSNFRSTANLPSGKIYATAAVDHGCDFVEFTPSPSITEELIKTALDRGVQVAGRDGSTGQTLLKVVLGNLFKMRNFEITSWYSTNLLGNHDGLVLSDADYAKWKMEDKQDALSPYATESTQHEVRIEFIRDRGDDKEAIDSIHLSGWLNSKHSLDLHWRGSDSFLAAPLILDLIRLVEVGPSLDQFKPGLQVQLGVFFKRPLQRESSTWDARLTELTNFYCTSDR